MPKLFVYDTNRPKTSTITLAFARGAIRHNSETNGKWQVKHMPITHYLQYGLPGDMRQGDAVATLGILRGTGEMLKDVKSKNLDYYYIDHAYFCPGYGGKCWLRITKNGHTCTNLQTVDKDRWNGFHKHHGYQCLPWKQNKDRGRNILVLPPTGAVAWFFNQGPDEWLNSIVNKLKTLLPEKEHFRIQVRRKPKEPVVDGRGNLLELKTYPQQDQPLENALMDAQCVIAYNSMVALEATMKGIPVITSENSCCTKVSFNLDVYNNQLHPEEFNIEPINRVPLLYWLAYNQWKRRDIEDGTAWRMLQEQN